MNRSDYTTMPTLIWSDMPYGFKFSESQYNVKSTFFELAYCNH